MSDCTHTLTVDGTTYELTDDFRRFVQRSAESAYESNEYVSTWWKQDSGDPVLVIETAGKRMPYEYIDQVATEEIDEEDEERLHFMQEPSEKENVAQVEREDDETTIPEKPVEMDEDDVLVAPMPSVDPYDKWSVGTAVAPMQGIYERNLQSMVDASGAIDDASEERDSSYTNGGGSWEALLEEFDCEAIDETDYTEEAPAAKRKPDGWYESAEEDEKVDRGQVGNRWDI